MALTGRPIKDLDIVIVGAGLMGSRIGRLFARGGAAVTFVDADVTLASCAVEGLRNSLGY
ncbi:3-hydroxyacyl-CoA dehydrogenase NAD-binding domain-containing protein [Knoellia sp. S7-12]|uniref:3-hydroxyacyl-CoA dehydrogenase NAD-binding domain-containing protein n=1 Tax=Knoellia sp. S7-12 TaxID=3126698 RepID=UPI0033684DF1